MKPTPLTPLSSSILITFLGLSSSTCPVNKEVTLLHPRSIENGY